MKSNNRFLTAVAFATAFLLSACGGGGGGPKEDPATYTVGGSVSGLSGTVGLRLSIAGAAASDLSRSTDGAFTFSTAALTGQSYAVTVQSHPSGQTCVVLDGTGEIGTSNITDVSVVCLANRTVGGTVSGLSGTVALRLSIDDGVATSDLSIGTNGSFTFPEVAFSGETYAVTVQSQPSGQTCTVGNGTGTIGSVNITNVSVTCTGTAPAVRTVGGSLTGLTGTVVLRIAVDSVPSANDLTLSTNGSFTFSHQLTAGQAYAVSVQTQPAGQTCSVSSGSGVIASANVTNVLVTCASSAPTFTVGGSVSGLTGTVVLRMMVQGIAEGFDVSRSVNGSFTFGEALTSGQVYSVAVHSQPNGQTCAVSDGSGTIGSANISNISVVCTTNTFTIGGSVVGLSSGTVVLRIRVNGVVVGSGLSLSANGPYTFPNTLTTGQTYAIEIQTQPSGHTCVVGNASGTMGTTNIVVVSVTCSLSCPATDGSNIGGLGFNGTVSYSDLTTAAATFDPSITTNWGIAYTNGLFAFTGSLRLSLWAVSSSFSGGNISGTKIATFFPTFTGPGAQTPNQLKNNFSATGSTTTFGTTPSAGTYCIVLTLDQFDPTNCTSSDDFCHTDHLQFPGAVTFQ
jgi:hypothetical protein